MKTKILVLAVVGFFAILHFCAGCSKDENSNYIDYAGNWVNEKKDTLFFYENDPGVYDRGSLILKNFNPHYTILYAYRMERDSLFLFPSHSSNLNDWKGYLMRSGTDEFVLFRYNDIEQSIYKRVK